VPVFHAALAAELPKPLAVLNLGASATSPGLRTDGALSPSTPPRNGRSTIGRIARTRPLRYADAPAWLPPPTPIRKVLARHLAHPYFALPPPKSPRPARLPPAFSWSVRAARPPPADGARHRSSPSATAAGRRAPHLCGAARGVLVARGGATAAVAARAAAPAAGVRPRSGGLGTDGAGGQPSACSLARVVRGQPAHLPAPPRALRADTAAAGRPIAPQRVSGRGVAPRRSRLRPLATCFREFRARAIWRWQRVVHSVRVSSSRRPRTRGGRLRRLRRNISVMRA
jgi:anhydro-N-acetylmuramic acid kinase